MYLENQSSSVQVSNGFIHRECKPGKPEGKGGWLQSEGITYTHIKISLIVPSNTEMLLEFWIKSGGGGKMREAAGLYVGMGEGACLCGIGEGACCPCGGVPRLSASSNH